MYSPIYIALLYSGLTIAANPYAPSLVPCPTTSLVRPATSIGSGEAQYIAARKHVADIALTIWLKKIDAGFNTSTLPTIGLAGSGGGYRALLNEAGVVQALDNRDSNSSMSGLYQAISYGKLLRSTQHAALSGGGWFANSLAAANWSTVTYLQKNVYEPKLNDGLLLPNGFGAPLAYARILRDVTAKKAAGYPVTIGDIYGRLIAYNLFPGQDGGVSFTMSGLTDSTNFTTHTVPYPIITSIGTNADSGNCTSAPNSVQYEFTPHEFGSWDAEVRAFTGMATLGSNFSNGTVANGKCAKGFDNLGFVTAATSNVFGGLCDPLLAGNSTLDKLANSLQAALVETTGTGSSELFNEIPNPFFGYGQASAVSTERALTLGDGDLSLQNDPIWPFIQPERNVSALIVADSCGDNDTTYYCTGRSPYYTVLQAQAHNLTKMPTVPPISSNLHLRR